MLAAYFAPLANPDYERFILRQARQKSDESVDDFYNRLRELASTCTLPDEQDEIRAQFIYGCASSKLREQILQDHRRTMQDILTLGRSKELSKARASHMEAAIQHPIKSEPERIRQKHKKKRRRHPLRIVPADYVEEHFPIEENVQQKDGNVQPVAN